MMTALHLARLDPEVGVIILTGAGEKAFCSGGDQKIRGEDGGYRDSHGVNHLNALDLQRMIRTLPKPVVAMVAGWAIGGGHVLHLVCDLTIAAENARFGQTGPKVGSFDAGFGAGLMSRAVGLKKAKEIWFLCRQYDAKEALEMGLVNTVVPLERLEEETMQWCREMLRHSPTALRVLKAGFNADSDGLAGVQELAGNATALFYMTQEGQEGRDAFVEKRRARFFQVHAASVTLERVVLRPYALPLKQAWRAASATLVERRGMLIGVFAEGLAGWGDCAPLPSSGELGHARAFAVLEQAAGALRGMTLDVALDGLAGIENAQARWAVETALLDLSARQRGLPLHRGAGREACAARRCQRSRRARLTTRCAERVAAALADGFSV